MAAEPFTPHEMNYHSTKLEFLALELAVTGHFKEYLPYQSFLVNTDNNPLTYIMTTPNLDATSHQWVRALVWFNFKLEYQKGCDNTVVDTLSQVTTWLDLDTMRSILNVLALGSVQWAKYTTPPVLRMAITWSKRYVLPQAMHLYKCMLLIGLMPRRRNCCWVQCWIGWRHRRRQIWRHFWQNTPPAKKAGWSYGISRILQFIREPYTCAQCPKVRPKIFYSFVVPKAHHVTTLNRCHRDVGHQGCDHTMSLLQEHFWWPCMANQMQQSIKSCACCLQHEGNLSKAPLHQLWPLLWWTSYM